MFFYIIPISVFGHKKKLRPKPELFKCLEVGFPQTVEVAVGVNSNCLVIAQMKGNIGGFARLQEFALTALFSLCIHPLNVMNFLHGMIHRANVDSNDAVLNGDSGDVLLAAGFYGVGNQRGHLLTAADGVDTRVVDHLYKIAAVRADIKLGVFHIVYLRYWDQWFVFYDLILSRYPAWFCDFLTKQRISY